MIEKITPFLKQLSDSTFIRRQYFVEKNELNGSVFNDPLMEDSHEIVKGLVHKYPNRALLKVSYQCAAHCRFCTRIRQIGNPLGTLDQRDIQNIIGYLKNNPQIDDVILSGGDPFYTPNITNEILLELRNIDSVKTIRIGTRMPFQSPNSFTSKPLLKLLSTITSVALEKPFFILIHIEHPDELTETTESVISQLRKCNVTLLSQTVFLKNINDNFEALHRMFKRIYHLGIIPYYLYRCDNVKGLEHFQVDRAVEKEIAVRLRKELSGIGCPLYVEDIEDGYGKVPII